MEGRETPDGKGCRDVVTFTAAMNLSHDVRQI